MRMNVFASLAFAIVLAGCAASKNPTTATPPRDTVANYTVTFRSTWSATTHPVDFPSNPHFSGLIGATHDNRVVFWREGDLASPGIQAMAELGSKSPLSEEVDAAIAAGSAQFKLSGGGISPSPGEVSLDFTISDSHPLVALVSMIAPSPDWFVGVADLPLFMSGSWVDSMTVSLYGWDAGTDEGTTYAAPNAPASPHIPIFALDGPIFNVGGTVPALGTYTFVRRH